MVLRSVLLIAAALSLSNCCLSSSNCNAPLANAAAPSPAVPPVRSPVAAAPTDWDGLNTPPEAKALDPEVIAVQPTRKQARRRADTVDAMSSQSAGSYGKDAGFAEQQALDQAEEQRLKQKLIICRNCSTAQ